MPSLVTGASGFIGSHLVHRLLASDEHTRALVRQSSSLKNLDEGSSSYELVRASLAAPSSLRDAMRGIEVVYHVAGSTAAFDRAGFDRTNVLGTGNVLTAAREAGVRRVVLVSSLMAAGPSHPDVARREHHRHDEGFSDYGDSKLAAEKLGWEMARSGDLEVVIVRPPLVYGPRDRDVLQMIRSAKMGVVAVPGFHEQWVSMVHVDDLVTGIIAAGMRGSPLPRSGPHVLAGDGRPHHHLPADPAPEEGRGIYYISDGSKRTVTEFGLLSAELMGRRALSVRLPKAAVVGVGWANQAIGRMRGRVPALTLDKAKSSLSPGWWCDDARARHDLDYVAQHDLRSGLEQTIAWLNDRGWL